MKAIKFCKIIFKSVVRQCHIWPGTLVRIIDFFLLNFQPKISLIYFILRINLHFIKIYLTLQIWSPLVYTL